MNSLSLSIYCLITIFIFFILIIHLIVYRFSSSKFVWWKFLTQPFPNSYPVFFVAIDYVLAEYVNMVLVVILVFALVSLSQGLLIMSIADG